MLQASWAAKFRQMPNGETLAVNALLAPSTWKPCSPKSSINIAYESYFMKLGCMAVLDAAM